MPAARHVGGEGEDAAAAFLLDMGWTIVKRNYKGGGGEIDIIALDQETLVFVEVKLRKGTFQPEASVDEAKQQRLRTAAERYLQDAGIGDRPCRFDVVAINQQGIRHLRDAL